MATAAARCLEYLLAASPEAVACGEVASVLRDRGRKGKCTCRRSIKECPVWGPLFASPDTLDGMSHEELSRALLAQDRGAHAILVELDQDRLALGRRPVSPCQCARGRLHARASRARPARGLLVRGEEGRPARRAPAAAAALGVGGTRLVGREPRLRAVRPQYPDRYMRLRYEDLARAPGEEMQGLFAKLVPGVRVAPPRRSARATTGISSMATACARRTCLSPRSGKTQRGSATCRASTARSSRSSPLRSAGATATLKSRERARRTRVGALA